MKKHENAIKMLMKNAIDTNTLYGWYEDDNGARLMTNGHLIIKLSGAAIDYVGTLQKMNDKNDDKRFTDQMNNIVDLAKKGEYKTAVNIQDVKAFDRYNTDRKPFINKYSDNSYIGFNPYYFSKLNILTGSDLLTITDSKSPIYIAGDDIECVLLPVFLDKNYNADNYAVFLEELKACYIQDEEVKKEKAAKKANKAAGIIPTLQPNKNYNGFTMSFYGVDYFILSDAKRITKSIITEFVKAYCKRNNFSDTVLNDMLSSKIQLDNIKARIEKATFILYTNVDNSAFTYIDIKTKYALNGCMYFECGNKLVLIDCVLPTSTGTKEETTTPDTCADDMSASAADVEKVAPVKVEKVASVQEPETSSKTEEIYSIYKKYTPCQYHVIRQYIDKWDIIANTRQTETTQGKPQKASAPAVSLFVVTDKPEPVKLPGYELPTFKQLDRIPMYVERFKTDFKQRNNARVYKSRVSNIKALKNDYTTFNSPVSCHNGMRAGVGAIGGKVAAGGHVQAVNTS